MKCDAMLLVSTRGKEVGRQCCRRRERCRRACSSRATADSEQTEHSWLPPPRPDQERPDIEYYSRVFCSTIVYP